MKPAARFIDGKDLICSIGDLGHVGSDDAPGRKRVAGDAKHFSQGLAQVVVVLRLGRQPVLDMLLALAAPDTVFGLGKKPRNGFQGRSRIGEDRKIGGMRAGKIGGIEIDADQPIVEDEIGSPEIGLRQFRTGAQDHIGVSHHLLSCGACQAIA